VQSLDAFSLDAQNRIKAVLADIDDTVTWTQVSVILIVILATVIVSEWVSAKIRHAII
jgi:ABC-type phosphate/phosphonate transport system permease subunit